MGLSDSAARLYEELPDYYGNAEEPEPLVARIVEGQAVELDRSRAIVKGLLAQSSPARADDEFGVLGRWEAQLMLPVQPSGATIEQRRAAVLSRLQSRRVAEGTSWRAAITTALGTEQWDVEPNTPHANAIEVTIPFDPGSYNARQAIEVLRRYTPAHLDIIIRTEGGFRVGISLVGVEAI
jgi:uncharacterized protein YmfQ (DUF2313 family)